jgi:hypothetical protein
LENHVRLSHGVQVVGEAWRAAMSIVAGVGELVQRTGDDRTGRVLGGRAIERLGGAVCSLHRPRGDVEHGFLGRASKPRSTVCEWFGLKTTWTVFVGLASKPVVTVSSGLSSKPAATVSGGLSSKPTATVSGHLSTKSVVTVSSGLASKLAATISGGLSTKPATTISDGLASKPAVTVFSSLASKLVVMVSPGLATKPVVGFFVEPQNQGGGGFPGLGLKTGSFGLVIWASKSLRWFLGLGLKTMRASFCQLHHKTDGGRSARDTCRDLAACFAWKQVRLEFPSLA